MRVKVLQVVWHNKDPVFSVDFHDSGTFATGGADGEIKLWKTATTRETVGVTFLSSVTGEAYDTGYKAWNVVRFSPDGSTLAAAGDMGQVYTFRPGDDASQSGSAPSWKATRLGAFSGAEMVDLSWAADSSGFVTASHDLSCVVWDPAARANAAKLRLEGHRLYVQGVAWDPHHHYIVSQAADRSCRVYSTQADVQTVKAKQKAEHRPAVTRLEALHCASVIKKRAQSVACTSADGRGGAARGCSQHLYHDESAETFFRRLCWSPDGAVLVTPAGVCRADDSSQQTNVAYVFRRGAWGSPLAQLPATKPVVAARFCPTFFERRIMDAEGPPSEGPPSDLPYSMVFAVATKDSVAIYNLHELVPVALLGNLHLEQITDLAWSPDGLTLLVSSYDGYCSMAVFEDGELGTRLEAARLPACCLGRVAPGAAEQMQQQASEVAAPETCSSGDDAAADVVQSSMEASRHLEEQTMPESSAGRVPLSIINIETKPADAGAPGGGGGFKRIRRIAPTPVPAEEP